MTYITIEFFRNLFRQTGFTRWTYDSRDSHFKFTVISSFFNEFLTKTTQNENAIDKQFVYVNKHVVEGL
ncbi:unnamed protein product [Schistosoma mattheei]|uniref:Uncharacterized protein n=1 Tax=Schistosoma mattheei TaxID=31246 RepID=A0A183PZD0_9TREM|nr:unnamed protein product [Schistosoma mattheei]